MNDAVSIIIAAYNIENYISDCLCSCINQTYSNIEIVVVNDGSSDNTGHICGKYALEDKRIVLIDKPNEGLVKARETGLKNSSNQFVFFLDGDDTIPHNAIELLTNAASSDTDIVIGEQRMINQNGTSKLRILDFIGTSNIDLINSIFRSANPNIVGHLYSKKIFKEIIYYDNLYKSIGEDLVTIVQVAYAADKIVKVPHVTYNYYRRNSSITVQSGNDIFAYGFKAFVIVTQFLQEKNIMEYVKASYFKLLKTFVTGYLNSSVSLNLYKKQIKDSVKFVISNWTDFIKSASLREKLFFIVAYFSLRISKLIIIQYNKYHTLNFKRSV